VLQFNWVLVNRIMSPIQTALFMVHAWPSHCDCLALVNAVHALKDKLLVSTIVTPFIQLASPSRVSYMHPAMIVPCMRLIRVFTTTCVLMWST